MSRLAVLLGGLLPLAVAQPARAADPSTELKKIVEPLEPPLEMGVLSVEDGLPQSQVNAIVQGPVGFLWFGTQEGLTRYDGQELRTFASSEEDPATPASNFISALAADDAGRLWIGSADGFITVYDTHTGTFRRLRPPAVEGAEQITALHVGSDGRLWVGTAVGFGALNPATEGLSMMDLGAVEDVAITSILETGDGSVWVGTRGEGLFRYEPTRARATQFTLGSGLLSDQVLALASASEGRIWVGTDSGLNEFDPEANRWRSYESDPGDVATLSDAEVNSILTDRTGTVWVGTRHGLNALDPARGSFVRYVSDPSRREAASFPDYVSCGMEDREGVLWFGSFSGARRITPLQRRFAYYPLGDYTNPMTVDDDGVIWVTTYRSGVYKIDRKNQVRTHYRWFENPNGESLELINHWFNAVLADGDTIWFGAEQLGLIAFDRKTETYRNWAPDPESRGQLNAARIDRIIKDGNHLYLATFGGGVNRFDMRTGRFDAFVNDPYDPASLASNYVYSLAKDETAPDVFWVGTAGGGLNRLNVKTGQAQGYAGSMVANDDVACIHQQDGMLWLGTYGGGLVRFDPNSSQDAKRYTTDQGLSNNTVFGVVPGDDGNLWLTTNGGGIVRFDPRQETFETFDRSDGVQGKQFVQNSYHRSASGELFFGGTNGLNSFFPKDIEVTPQPPLAVVTRYKLFEDEPELETPIWRQPKLELGFRDDVLSFEFAALSFGTPGRNRFAYRLEGLYDEWVETERPFASFTNLDGGNYVFQVKAKNRTGVWSETLAEVPIWVAPPPWKTWWAFILYGLGVGGLVFGYMRYQQGKLQKLQQENRLSAVERELELTGAIQTGFLPKSNYAKNRAVELAGFYRPADQCSGDWWWYEEDPTRRYTIIVGDVTGHGAGAAMVTAAAATALRIQGRRGPVPLSEKLAALHDQVLTVAEGKYMMTMSVLDLDPETGHYRYYSAAGLPVMRLLPGQDRPKMVNCPGTPVGAQSFEAGTIEGQMEPGERMLIMTDGIPETILPSGKQLGMRKFTEFYKMSREMPVAQAVQFIVQSADQARENVPQDDDWTFTIIEFNPNGAVPSA